jgi:hypothetical protein
MAEIKKLVPWLHDKKIRLEVVYIRSEANLVDAPSRQRLPALRTVQSLLQTPLPRLVRGNCGGD